MQNLKTDFTLKPLYDKKKNLHEVVLDSITRISVKNWNYQFDFDVKLYQEMKDEEERPINPGIGKYPS